MANRVARLSTLCLLAGWLTWAQSGSEGKPALYTYVSEWTVPRAMWAEYQKMEGSDDELMGKAVGDGTLMEFGSYSVLNHQEGQPTHGSWFSAGSMANLMKMLEQLRSAPNATGPVLAASKHWDYILVSHDYNGHSGTCKNAYLRVGQWRYKAGASDPGGKIIRGTIVAVLEKLFNDGALQEYSIDEEAVHSSDPNSFDIAIVANGAAGIDKFDAAMDDLEKNNPAAEAALDSLIDPHGHRDFLAHVDAMSHK